MPHPSLFVVAPLLLLFKSANVVAERGRGEMELAMTQAKWWLLGAVLLGIAIFVYLLFFCPTECH